MGLPKRSSLPFSAFSHRYLCESMYVSYLSLGISRISSIADRDTKEKAPKRRKNKVILKKVDRDPPPVLNLHLGSKRKTHKTNRLIVNIPHRVIDAMKRSKTFGATESDSASVPIDESSDSDPEERVVESSTDKDSDYKPVQITLPRSSIKTVSKQNSPAKSAVQVLSSLGRKRQRKSRRSRCPRRKRAFGDNAKRKKTRQLAQSSDEKSNRCRGKIQSALALRLIKGGRSGDYDESKDATVHLQVAAAIEEALYMNNSSNWRAYKTQARSALADLSANASIRRKLLSGELTAKEFSIMDFEQRAPDNLKKQREKERVENLRWKQYCPDVHAPVNTIGVQSDSDLADRDDDSDWSQEWAPVPSRASSKTHDHTSSINPLAADRHQIDLTLCEGLDLSHFWDECEEESSSARHSPWESARAACLDNGQQRRDIVDLTI